MKRELVEQAVLASEKMIAAYWLGDPEPCIGYLGDTVDWTGSGAHEHVHSDSASWADMLRKYAAQNPKVYLTEAVYYPVETYRDGCVVFGTYIGQTDPDSGYLIRERQRATFTWKVKGERLVMTSLHLSNPMETVKPGESFPFTISKSSWEYVRHQISMGVRRDAEQLVVKAVGGSLHVLARNDVLYLEAQDRYTIVHSIEDKFTVRACLSEMEAKAGEQFLRVGRSYAVNVRHVKRFEKAGIVLFDGTELPIPERNVAALRDAFLLKMK